MSLLPDPLHPALVHVPIALVLTALAFEVAALVPRFRTHARSAPVLWVVAAAGAVAAVLSGEAAHDAAVVPQAARALVGQHEDLATAAMWLLLAFAVVRVAAAVWFADASWVRIVVLLLALGCAGLVGFVGHLGGQLVFRHGVGTLPVQRGAAAPR